MGRPTKKTPARVNKIIEAIEKGHTRAAACRAAGVHYSNFSDWMKADDELKARVEQAEAKAEFTVVENLLENMTNRDRWEWLKRRRREWTENSRVEHSGEVKTGPGVIVIHAPVPNDPDDRPE